MSGFFNPSELAQERPVGTVPRCGACGLYKDCRSPKMKPYGRGDMKVLVLGEAPGELEDEDDRPFIGQSGQLLRDTLKDAGFYLDDDAITTNSVICHPEGNATPTAKQIEYCRPNLINTLEEVDPVVVVTLGRSALESILPLVGWKKSDIGSLERWTGWQIPTKRFWLCPTWHPSYLLRTHNAVLEKLFRQHLKSAFSLGEGERPRPADVSNITIEYDPAKAAEIIDGMEYEGGWVAVDYETNCLKPEYPKSEIVSCAISNGERTISFPWLGEAIDATRDLLLSKHITKIAANLKFEERWTRFEFGRGVVNWGWDTMLAAHCVDNRTGITGLKFQSFVKLGAGSYNDVVHPYLESKGRYNRVRECDPDTLLRYGAMDALLEYELAMKQRKEFGI